MEGFCSISKFLILKKLLTQGLFYIEKYARVAHIWKINLRKEQGVRHVRGNAWIVRQEDLQKDQQLKKLAGLPARHRLMVWQQ
jgi:hypothetical protein